MSQKTLKRSIKLPYITLYGLGTILGAGIYVLIGKVAGIAGMYAPLAFLIAAFIAGFSAFSYSELASRYPKSSGESSYVSAAFNIDALSKMVGWLVIITGIVSAAAIANGFVGYLKIFVSIEPNIAISILVVGLTLLAIWGITESVTFATIVTIVEILGLVFVIVIASDALFELPHRWHELIPTETSSWNNIFIASFVAFYAFIGFEDMVNIAEEVVDPNKNMPRAIITAFTLGTILYVLVTATAVLAVNPTELESAEAPFAHIISTRSNYSISHITAISLIAVVNGALVQIIMASRVLYGMSCQGFGINAFTKINSKTQTPITATAVIGGVVLILALWFPLITLAKATSYVILVIFILINISLIRIKMKTPIAYGTVSYTIFIPCVGAVLSTILILLQIYSIVF